MAAPQNLPFVQAPQSSDAIAASGITIPPDLFNTATQNDIVVAGGYYREAKRLCLQHPPQADQVDVINAKVYETEVIVSMSLGAQLQSTFAAALVPLTAQVTALSGQVASLDAALVPLTAQVTALSGQVASLDGRLGALDGRIGALDGRLGALENSIDGRLGALENSIAVQSARGFNGSATTLEHMLLPVPNNTGALPDNLHFPRSFGDILGHESSLTSPQLHALLQFYGADLPGANVPLLRTSLARVIGIRRV